MIVGLRLLSPTGSLVVRGPDSYSGDGGFFGAGRSRWVQEAGRMVNKARPHLGIDLVCEPGAALVWPCGGLFVLRGQAYPDDLRFFSVHVSPDGQPAGVRVKVLYARPDVAAWPSCVHRGERMGSAQDLRLRYPDPDGAGPAGPIVNHVHVEVRLDGVAVDPTPYLEVA